MIFAIAFQFLLNNLVFYQNRESISPTKIFGIGNTFLCTKNKINVVKNQLLFFSRTTTHSHSYWLHVCSYSYKK